MHIPDFIRSLWAEVLKANKSLAMWLALLGTSGIIVAFLAMLFFGTENFLPTGNQHPWHNFLMIYYKGTAFMLLPLFAIIMAALVCYIEYRYGMWKLLLSSGISRTNLYLSKLLFTYFLIIVSHGFFISMMLISGAILAVFRPQLLLLESPPDFMLLVRLAIKTLLSVAGMLALQFWVSMRFRSFIVALGVGVIGFVLSSLLVEAWPYVHFIPYAYPLLYLDQVEQGKLIGRNELLSLLYFSIFSLVGLLDFRRMRISM